MADLLVSTRICHYPFASARNSTAPLQHTKKFNILHDWRLRKPAEVFEELPPAENAMIAASHPQ
jgi:hypothetical protein